MSDPEIEVTKPVEQWSNGLMNHWFKYGPFEYRVMQRGWIKDDPEETTVILSDTSGLSPAYTSPDYRRWNNHVLKYGIVFDGLITPLAAARIVQVCDTSYDTGYKHGYADAQADIRKALGIK